MKRVGFWPPFLPMPSAKGCLHSRADTPSCLGVCPAGVPVQPLEAGSGTLGISGSRERETQVWVGTGHQHCKFSPYGGVWSKKGQDSRAGTRARQVTCLSAKLKEASLSGSYKGRLAPASLWSWPCGGRAL